VPGHKFACWFPVGTPEGREALERNRAAGVPAAVLGDGAATASAGPSTAEVS
jgi:hypothetical protein